jgi:hypothetical protein
MVAADVFALPFLERLYNVNNYNPTNVRAPSASRRSQQRPKTTKAGRSYKDICRVINPNPYAFPNKVPFPSAPVC